MSVLDERESAFESKFAHDEELRFRVESRRTKLVAAWAAGVMGLNPAESQAYVHGLIAADLQEAGSDDVLRKVTQDIAAKGIDTHGLHISRKMDELLQVAKAQIRDEHA